MIFIYQSIGIATAAKTYFGKNQIDLDVQESAILIGMLKSSYLYNPKIKPENSTKRKKRSNEAKWLENNKLSQEKI